MTTDIFEDMKDWVGCKYVSDQPYRKREVWGQAALAACLSKGTTGKILPLCV